MKNTLEITINGLSNGVKEEIIAILSNQNFDAFEEDEEDLKAFIKEDNFDESQLNVLMQSFNLSFSIRIIVEQNWNEVWESNFSPVLVDDFCAIRAEFHPPFFEMEHIIHITPKMSFGTGHHATTYMMVQQMRYLDLLDKKVADFGTGTGVLAILAEKMGSKKIVAIDYDDWSIENAKENIARNNCKNILLEKNDVFPLDNKFDVILANINKNVILENAQSLSSSIFSNGLLLLSGLLTEDEKDVLQVFTSSGCSHIHTVEKNNWICILLKRDNTI